MPGHANSTPSTKPHGPALPIVSLALLIAGAAVGLALQWLAGVALILASLVVAAIAVRRRAAARPLAIAVLVIDALIVAALAFLIGSTLATLLQVNSALQAYGM